MKLFSIIATFALPLVVNAAASPDASDMMLGNNDEVLVESSKSFRKGAAICTYAPNTECFPDTNGFPPCCSTLGGDCKDGARTPSDIACPASVCTNHGIGCYTNKGMPGCCTQNGGSGCTFYDNLSCDVPLSPAPTPSRSPPGADVCTLPPNTNCYKRKGGYPRCCFTTKTCIQQGFTPSNPPPCDTSGLEGALEDQLAEFDAIYKDADYDEITINEDVDSEAKGYLRG